LLRLLSNEDFNNTIVRGVLRQHPSIDSVRVQDGGLRTQRGSIVLGWAATERRVVLTHDANAMTAEAYKRVSEGLDMPGLFVISQDEATSRVIEDTILLAEVSLENEWEGQVNHLPLK
jgi:predicted nuclease of predicted toxin-antitoxin system